MPKGIVNKKYSGAFKQKLIEDMWGNHLSQNETAAKYGVPRSRIQSWERMYLESGAESLYEERRGRSRSGKGMPKGHQTKLSKAVEEDLIAENQRLRAENDYLKNLHALVEQRVQREKKRK